MAQFVIHSCALSRVRFAPIGLGENDPSPCPKGKGLGLESRRARRGEKADHVIVAAFFGPRAQRSVAANLVVLDSLRARDDRSIDHRLVSDLTGNFVGLLEDAIDRGARRTARLVAELRENLIETFDLPFRLVPPGDDSFCNTIGEVTPFSGPLDGRVGSPLTYSGRAAFSTGLARLR